MNHQKNELKLVIYDLKPPVPNEDDRVTVHIGGRKYEYCIWGSSMEYQTVPFSNHPERSHERFVQSASYILNLEPVVVLEKNHD